MNEIKAATAKIPLRLPRLNDITSSVLLILASRATALGMFPFGIAFFAAAYDKSIAYIGIAAVCAGIMSASGTAAVPKYVIALVILWLFSKLYRKKDELINAAAVAAALLCGGAVMLVSNYNGIYDIFLLITESIISALMYVVFTKSRMVSDDFTKRGRMSPEEYISAAVAAGVVISGLSGVMIGPLRIANIFSVYVILLTALNSSVSAAGCTGLCIGFMSCMSSSASVVMMGIFGMSAVFASFLNCYKKWGAAAGFLCGTAVTLIYVKNMYNIPMSVSDAAAGALLFIATPRIMQEYFRSFFDKSMQVESVSPEQRMREYLTMRLTRAGEAFGSLHECFTAVSEARLRKYSDDIGIILDETAERVCRGCKLCGKCWQKDFRRTYKNVLGLIGIIESEGVLNRENIPEHFCERCVNTDRFIYEINHVYELYKRELLRRSDAVSSRNLLSMQYDELKRFINGLAGDIEDGFFFLEREEEQIVDELDRIGIVPYEISVVESASGGCEIYLRLPPVTGHTVVEGVVSDVLGRAVKYEETKNGLSRYVTRPGYSFDSAVLQLPREGMEVNGDSLAVFGDGCGKFYAIAADGMGSGREAKYESAAALRLLTGFLKAGFGVKTAVGILNSSLCLNMDNEMYSTIDILSVNMYTGEAELYKIGGAETVIQSGDEVKTISSVSAPVGIISDIRLDRKVLELKEGDIVLIMTDGVTGAGYTAARTEWIKNIVIKPHETMEELAREVMDTALSKNRGRARDDMSIIALRMLGV